MALSLDGTTGITSDGGTPVIENLDTTATGIEVTGDLTVDTNTLYVDSANNRVGIGTTSPTSSKLHIDGGDLRIQDVTPNIYLYSEGAVNNVRINANISDVAQGGIEIYENANALIKSRTNFTQFYSANTERMRLDSSGNVGIGTSSPAFVLDAKRNANDSLTRVNAQNSNAGSSAVTMIGLGNDQSATASGLKLGSSTWASGANTMEVFNNLTGGMFFSTSGTERIRINNSGNVGIGTSSPTGKLNVYSGDSGATTDGSADELFLEQAGNSGLTIGTPNTSTASIFFADPESSSAGRIQYLHTSNSLTFGTAAAERMRIDSSGNVGIGTSSPAYKLQVSPGTYADQLAVFNEAGTWTANGGVVIADYYAATTLIGGIKISAATSTSGYLSFHTGGTTERMRIDSSGKVGIGTSSPAQKFVISESGVNFVTSVGGGTQYVGTTTNNSMAFIVNSNEYARIDTSGNLKFNSGYGSVATAYGCRAWVNFNGQGTVAIRGSGNVSSITDNGTGDYTVNFTTAMSDANYSAAITASDYWRTHGVNDSSFMTASSFRFKNAIPNTAALNDPNVACVTVFR